MCEKNRKIFYIFLKTPAALNKDRRGKREERDRGREGEMSLTFRRISDPSMANLTSPDLCPKGNRPTRLWRSIINCQRRSTPGPDKVWIWPSLLSVAHKNSATYSTWFKRLSQANEFSTKIRAQETHTSDWHVDENCHVQSLQVCSFFRKASSLARFTDFLPSGTLMRSNFLSIYSEDDAHFNMTSFSTSKSFKWSVGFWPRDTHILQHVTVREILSLANYVRIFPCSVIRASYGQSTQRWRNSMLQKFF